MKLTEIIKVVIDWLGETHGLAHGAPAPNWLTIICLIGIVWAVIDNVFKK
jgi:hypothetical protein